MTVLRLPGRIVRRALGQRGVRGHPAVVDPVARLGREGRLMRIIVAEQSGNATGSRADWVYLAQDHPVVRHHLLALIRVPVEVGVLNTVVHPGREVGRQVGRLMRIIAVE